MSQAAEVPISTAAAVVGCSRATFHRRFVKPGRVEIGARGVVLVSLEKHTGPISAERLVLAQKKLEPRRAWQREYAANKRQEKINVAA
jgi:hypothetical protein